MFITICSEQYGYITRLNADSSRNLNAELFVIPFKKKRLKIIRSE